MTTLRQQAIGNVMAGWLANEEEELRRADELEDVRKRADRSARAEAIISANNELVRNSQRKRMSEMPFSEPPPVRYGRKGLQRIHGK